MLVCCVWCVCTTAGESLGSRGVRRLALGVAKLPVLISLNLADNGADNDGVQALVEALPGCRWLRHLNLARASHGRTAGVADCGRAQLVVVVVVVLGWGVAGELTPLYLPTYRTTVAALRYPLCCALRLALHCGLLRVYVWQATTLTTKPRCHWQRRAPIATTWCWWT